MTPPASSTTQRTARPGRFPALRHRHFTLFWAGHIISRVGTQMRDVALAWQLYELTHSPLALGLLGACRVAPIFVFAMGGGVVADAFDRRRLMLATQTIFLVTSAAMALLTRFGLATPGLLYLLVAFTATATAFDIPARQALVVNLVPEEDLPNGLTLNIFGWQTATVLGPAAGGALLAVTSVEAIYVIDAVSFLAVIAALAVVKPIRSIAPSAVPGVGFGAVAQAWRFLRTQPVLVWLMGLDFLATLFGGCQALSPFFAAEIFHVGKQGLGLIMGAPAAGSLMAAAWMSLRPPIRRQGAVVLGAVVAYGVCIAIFGMVRSFPLALLLLAGSGAADAVSTVVRQVVRQTLTPDEMRGRMTGIHMMFFIGGPQLGEFEAGLVASALASVRLSVISGGIACVLMAIAMAAGSPALRGLGGRKRTGIEPAQDSETAPHRF